MEAEKLLELLIKKEQGIISLAEQVELAKLLNEGSVGAEAQKLVDNFFNTHADFIGSFQKKDIEDSLIKLNERINRPATIKSETKSIHWWKALAVAASVLFLIGVGFKLFTHSQRSNLQQTVSTTERSKSNITLPDGSKVWINSDTKITYDKSFGDGNRELTLEGEAYFDVVKDKNRPFIVRTKTLDIKVLGTAFNVRAYSNEATTQATLVRGIVEVVMKKKNNEKITLKPSEKITVRNNNEKQHELQNNSTVDMQEIVLSKVAPNPIDSGFLETQWIKPNISFDQQKLEDIIPMLENWYHVNITVSNVTLLKRRFSGKIEKESLTEILESFKLASGLKYKINGDEITIYK